MKKRFREQWKMDWKNINGFCLQRDKDNVSIWKKPYLKISIKPFTRRVFCFMYFYGCTTHQSNFFSFKNYSFYSYYTIKLPNRKRLRPRPTLTHSRWTRITPPSRLSALRWYSFHYQHGTPSVLPHVALHSNRYHFDGMSKTFCTYTCSSWHSPRLLSLAFTLLSRPLSPIFSSIMSTT